MISLKTIAYAIILPLTLAYCTPTKEKYNVSTFNKEGVQLIVLGTAQDGGSPHIGCKKLCCIALFDENNFERKVVSLGLIDFDNQKTYLFEATPDLSTQIKQLTVHTKSAMLDCHCLPGSRFARTNVCKF